MSALRSVKGLEKRDQIFAVVVLATLVFGLSSIAFLSNKLYFKTVFILFLCLIFFVGFEFEIRHLAKTKWDGLSIGQVALSLVKCAAISIFVAVVLEFATVFGYPKNSWGLLGCVSPSRLVCFTALVLLAVLLCIHYNAKLKVIDAWRHFVECKTKVAVGAVAVVLSAFVAAVFSFFLSTSIGDGRLVYENLALLICFSLTAIASIVGFRNVYRNKPEVLFALVSLSMGAVLVFVQPTVCLISWDESVHFVQALSLSFLTDSVFTSPDLIVAYPNVPAEIAMPDTGSATSVEAFNNAMNSAYSTGNAFKTGLLATLSGESILSITTVGYVPNAFGLWLGRLLHVPYATLFAFGKLGNLLFYTAIMYAAIKIIPTKKVFLTVFALMPINIFLASHYSYDPWVTALVCLSIALFVREAYFRTGPISMTCWVLMLLTMALALMPKAIYFPLFGLFLLMPRGRFADVRQRRIFYATVVFAALVMLASFALPFVSSGGGTSGDERGGSDVSGSGQLSWVLSNPVGFMGVLGSFLANTYLTPTELGNMFTLYAYYGQPLLSLTPGLQGFPLLFLVVVFLLDSDGEFACCLSAGSRLWSLVIFACTAALIATALYISFTPVGHYTVNGCQERYLLPLLFPVALFAASCSFGGKRSKGLLTHVSVSVSFLLLLGSAIPVVMKIAGW